MTFCANCGQELDDDWVACPKCGTRIVERAPADPEPERETAAPQALLAGDAAGALAEPAAPARPSPDGAGQTNGLAVASLVLGIVWLWGVGSVLALVFGLRARGQIKRSAGRLHGAGLAVAGITLGIVGIVGAAIVTASLVSVNHAVDDLSPKIKADTSGSSPRSRPRAAHVGNAITLNASNNAQLSVTAQQVIDPASGANEFNTPDSGKRFVAVKLRVSNFGSGTYDGNMNNGTTIIGNNGQTYTADANEITGCTNFNNGELTIGPESSATGCVVFQLPIGVSAARVQFNPNSGFGGETAEWTNP
jgi:predicted RNA-binding Zn-ribbon protein involved in translation (DUF1610 family)